MLTGTQMKSMARKIIVIGLLGTASIALAGCEDRTMPVPAENVPTVTPTPLITEDPVENTKNVAEDVAVEVVPGGVTGEVSEDAPSEVIENAPEEELLEEQIREEPDTEGVVEEDPAETFFPAEG